MVDNIFLNGILHDDLASVTIEHVHLQIRSKSTVCVTIVLEFGNTSAD